MQGLLERSALSQQQAGAVVRARGMQGGARSPHRMDLADPSPTADPVSE